MFNRLISLAFVFRSPFRYLAVSKTKILQPRLVSTTNFYIRRFFLQQNSNIKSIVSKIANSPLLKPTHTRPNSLLRAFSGLSSVVQLRDQFKSNSNNFSKSVFLINKSSAMLSTTKDKFLFKSLLLSATKYSLGVGNITPKDFIGAGCNGAVWSVALQNNEDINSSELAVKVLYNYYDDSASVELDENLPPMSWHLLRQQLVRECNMRPETGHPNILPILGHFVDKAPPGKASEFADSRPDVSSTHKTWVGSENFPEAFKDEKRTCYLLMPKFEATLADLIEGKWRQYIGSNSYCSPKGHPSLVDLSQWSSVVQSGPESPRSTHSSTSFSVLNETSSSSCSFFNMSARSIDIKLPSRGFGDTTEPIPEYLQPQNATLTDHEPLAYNNMNPSIYDDEAKSISILDEQESISVISDFNRNSSNGLNGKLPLSTDEAIAILAQIFEAIQELEKRNIAHRDIKLNNFLIRTRNGKLNSNDLNQQVFCDNREARLLNSNLLVALTDFGCSIPTKQLQPQPMPRVGSGSSFASMAIKQEKPSEDRSSLDQLTSLLFKTPFFSGESSTETKKIRKLSLASFMGPNEHFNHSGNQSYLAPEVATALKNKELLNPQLYARADIWSAALLAYPIFGIPNPFDGDLDSTTYKESDLPQFPPSCPGPVALLMLDCLRRNPHERPPAELVADVLHTICLVRHARRRVQRTAPSNTSRLLQDAAKSRRSKMNSYSFSPEDEEDSSSETYDNDTKLLRLNPNIPDLLIWNKLNSRVIQWLKIDLLNLDGQSVELRTEINKEFLDYWKLLEVAHNHIKNEKLSSQLLHFLQVWWAADWLMGPARAPQGLRCLFYRRLTLDKLSLCLKLIRKFEARYSVMLAKRMFT